MRHPHLRSLRKYLLDVEQSLIEVRDNVFDIFDADAEPNQAIGDPNAVAHFLRHGRVRHLCGKRDQRFHAAEAFRSEQIFTLFRNRRAASSLPTSKESIAPGPFCCRAPGHAADETKPGVIHLTHLGMRVEVPCHGLSIGVVLEHCTASVLIPREVRKQSIGARPAPAERWMK